MIKLTCEKDWNGNEESCDGTGARQGRLLEIFIRPATKEEKD